jgi:hypothetical protein
MLGRLSRPASAVALLLASFSIASVAAADEAAPTPPPPPPRSAEKNAAAETKSGYVQLFTTTFLGDGLRFNNPYRLATPLGSTAQSVSRTAAYVDLGLAATLGAPMGFQHGLAVRLSLAIEGVPQSVLAPSYLLWRRWRSWAAYGRASVPIVLTPDPTVGFEAGVGGVWFVRGGIGVTAEIVGDLFYGAGTREVATPAYPLLSAQLGLTIAYEVLP